MDAESRFAAVPLSPVASEPFSLEAGSDYGSGHEQVMSLLASLVNVQGDSVGAAPDRREFYASPDWLDGGSLFSESDAGWGRWGVGVPEDGLLGEYLVVKDSAVEGRVLLAITDRSTPGNPIRDYFWDERARQGNQRA